MQRKAFTIVELLVVITIIGLLMGVVGYNVANIRKSSRDATRISNILEIGKAVDSYAQANRGLYPRNASNPPSSAYAASDNKMCADKADLDLSFFTSKAIPKDPKPVTTPSNCADASQGYIYHTRYTTTGNFASVAGTQYALEVSLEDTKPSDESTLKTPVELGLSSAFATVGGRTRYLLVGPYCGTSNTCAK